MTARVRTYDAKDLAIGMTERFKDRPWEYQNELPFDWPAQMQAVGDSLAVAYASDKWEQKGQNGKRKWELYKHLAESRNRALVRRGLLKNYYAPNRGWPVKGPMVSLTSVPMPEHFSILGLFEEIDLALYTKGSGRAVAFSSDPDEGIVKVTLRHGMLGGSYIRWSEVSSRSDQPFLFVYTESAGVCIIVVGDELSVKKDGIAG